VERRERMEIEDDPAGDDFISLCARSLREAIQLTRLDGDACAVAIGRCDCSLARS